MKKTFITLALGLVAFTFAQQNNQNKEQRKEALQQKQQEHLDKMQKDLNLSADQLKQIKTLQDKNIEEMQALRAQRMEARKMKLQEMKAKKDAHEAEMKKILSPDQFQKWQKQRDEDWSERKEKIRQRRGNLETPAVR